MNTSKSVIYGWVVLSGSALAAYVIARNGIAERRREEGLKQLEERQVEIKAGRAREDPLADSIPVDLGFEERLEWLERRLEEKARLKKAIVEAADEK